MTWPPARLENEVKGLVRDLLNAMTNTLESVKCNGANTSQTQSAVASFLRRESEFLNLLLCEIIRELRLLLGACEGRVSFTPHLHSVAACLARLGVPCGWLAGCSGDASLAEWLESLQCRVQAVSEYILPEPLQPHSFCLGAFVHQQAFLASVLIDHAKSHVKSVHSLKLAVEVRR